MGVRAEDGVPMVGMIVGLVEVWSAFAIYSLISAIISLILVIISGVFIKSEYRGLLERLGVTPYQLYYFVLSLMVCLNRPFCVA